ncbi:MAG: bifunctional oligoribonuclease/PAP phosphatase NrnA [Candidatus Cryptobacteroides sp.]|nr:bifunctional oligoribonuclease/PAP phosphatase NrnA [Candidatus Cryptobacteroides sp.]
MQAVSQENIRAFREAIQQSTRIAVVGHTHPDGDALGSCTALSLWLAGRGKAVSCIFPDTPADNLLFILSPKVNYLYGDAHAAAARKALEACELLIQLDCNQFSRTEGLAPFLEASSAQKILIDHHLNPDRESFDIVFSTPEISSASELLYWVLKAAEGDTLGPLGLGMTIGTALMAGMTTDTNNFANSVFPSTFQMASELIAAGVNRDALLQQLYSSYRENRVRLMGYMQYEGLKVLPEGAAYMILTKEIMTRFDLREGESEGLVNVPLSIGAVKLSVLLKEDDGHFRVSVRSKKGTSAQQLAVRFFHGGGHENASGGKLFIGADIANAQAAEAYVSNALKTFLG